MPHANELLMQRYLVQTKLLCCLYQYKLLTLSAQAQAHPVLTGNMDHTWCSTAASAPIDKPSAFLSSLRF